MKDETLGASPTGDADSSFRPLYSYYVLSLLTLTAVLNVVDRQILGIFLIQIKTEFGLQDSQLGVLTGPVFSVIFVSMTLPIAIIADRTSRKNVIAICTMFFSMMTALCGMAASFWQLCLARFGVGIGEAGTLPAGTSILTDLFPPERRARAMAVQSTGVNIGLLVSYFAGGMTADAYGWRTGFLIAGAPGVLLSILFFTTVRENRASHSAAGEKNSVSFTEAFRHMWAIPAFRWITAGSALVVWSMSAMFAFTPLFLAQTHGLSASRVGFILAFYCGVLGMIATLTAGALADRLGKRSWAMTMLVPTISYGITVPFVLIFYLAPGFELSIIAGAIPLMMAMTYGAPTYALAQTMAPPHMRSQAAAILITAGYLIGAALGPLIVGAASDALGPVGGKRSMGYALTLVALSNIGAAFCYWRAYRVLKAEEQPVTA